MITLSNLIDKINEEKSVAIFTHIRPDGDAIGSSVALKLALLKLGKTVEVFCDDVIPEKFHFLSETLKIKNTFSGTFDAYISVDCAEITRLGSFSEEFINHKKTFNIDHHISNTKFAKENYVVENASNCENIFDLIEELDVAFSEDIANLLLLGIITDTGNFRHKSVTPTTFFKAGELVKCGANVNAIQYNTFFKQSKERAKLHAMVMGKTRYFLENRLAIISIFKDDLEKSGAKIEETEGFIDFIMGIECVEVGISILEMGNNKYKCSLRAKNTDVNDVASVFGGGGHILASGCQIQGEYEEVVDKLVFAVKQRIVE